MGEVPEPQGGTAEVFEAAVQGFGRAVRRAGSVEVGQHVGGAFLQGASEGDDLT